jgi:putative flippase GtrA
VQLPPKERMAKYVAASAVGVVTGSTLLLFFLKVVDLEPVPANVAAVTLSSIPAYLINRAWVWNKTSGHSIKREIVPFWTLAFLGLLLSTILVDYVTDHTDNDLLILMANWGGFAILWVAKFFILDKVLFGPGGATPEEHMEPPPLL